MANQQPSTLRRRRSTTSPASQPPAASPSPPKKPKAPSQSFPSFLKTVLCLALATAILYATSQFSEYRIGTSTRREHIFRTDNALDHIGTIAARPRWAGSQALQSSMQYIHTQLEALQPIALQNQLHLDLDIFRSGPDTFSTSITDIEIINSYSNITSVVARLRPASLPFDTNSSALLINAHVDSAIGSPGANDNVCGVGIVTELVRCMASIDDPNRMLRRPVVFLFNGAEEPILLGAHSFITQHPWANPIAAHINLESIGSGRAYHLFRLGPDSPWLANAYADAVSVPLASVSSTDVFDANIIPGETDFRIFSEFGIPGFDFVLLDNAYVYHTTHDDVDHVDPAGVQHGGITVFEVAMQLAGPQDAIGSHLASIEKQAMDKKTSRFPSLKAYLGRSRAVFFDVLHIVTIVYDENIAILINLFTLVATAAIWLFKLKVMSRRDKFVCLRMTAVVILTLVATALSASFAALIYTYLLKSPLRWYGSSVTALCIYGPPSLFGAVSALLLFLPRHLSKHRFEQMLFGIAIVNGFMVAGLTAIGFMTAYMPMILLWTCTLCALLRNHPIVKYFIVIVAQAILQVRLQASTLSVLLSILGRVKSTVVPSEVIAGIIVTYSVWTTLLLPSLPLLCYYAVGLRKVRVFAFLMAIAVVVWLKYFDITTPQPIYSVDAPKRIITLHFYAPQNDPPSTVLIGGMDPNPGNIQRITPEAASYADSNSSTSLPTWGSLQSNVIETIRPFDRFLTEWALFAADDLDFPLPSASVIKEEAVAAGGWNVTIRLQGKDSHQLTVRIPTGEESPVKGWSVKAHVDHRKDGAWIRHVGSTEFEFWLWLVDPTNSTNRPKIAVALTAGRLGASRSSVLSRLKFEQWEAPVFLVSTGLELEL